MSAGIDSFIGRLDVPEKQEALRNTINALRRAGFAPSSVYTAPQVIAYVPERGLLIQEKAPGALLKDTLVLGDTSAIAVRQAARWLAALHVSTVGAVAASSRIADVQRYTDELMVELPHAANRLQALAAAALEQLRHDDGLELVPTHGDYHPKNVFIDGERRVTVIDFDTFRLRTREADVGYFLAHLAIAGYRRRNSLLVSLHDRRIGLATYEENSGRALNRQRLAVFLGLALLESVHYDWCITRTGDSEKPANCLTAAAECLLHHRMDSLKPPGRPVG